MAHVDRVIGYITTTGFVARGCWTVNLGSSVVWLATVRMADPGVSAVSEAGVNRYPDLNTAVAVTLLRLP